MKRPIDPNLNISNNDDLLPEVAPSDSIAEKKRKEVESVDFSAAGGSVSEKPKRDKVEELNSIISEVAERSNDFAAENSEGEHSKSTSSHHHSSGEHHHSSSSHHSSSHYHSSKKKKKKLPTPAKIALIVVAIILIIVIVLLITFFVLRAQGQKDVMPTVTDDDVAYEETIEYNGHTYQYNKNVFSVAFLGIDQRDLETSDNTDFVGAADADIVVSVDTQTGKSTVIAIPRDTMVDVDIWSESGIFLRTEEAQLCLAYSYGDGAEQSCQNSLNSISRILYNVPIEKYFALDLDGIAPLNDAIGGVTIDSSLYKFTDLGIDVGDQVTLVGDMAETYVRLRDMDNINASLNRTDRQVQYVKAYAQQVVPAVMKNFSVVSSLYSTASSYSQTNLTLSNATYIASLMLSKGVTSFDTYTISGTMTSSEDALLPDVVHAEFTPDEDSLMEAVLAAFYTQID